MSIGFKSYVDTNSAIIGNPGAGASGQTVNAATLLTLLVQGGVLQEAFLQIPGLATMGLEQDFQSGYLTSTNPGKGGGLFVYGSMLSFGTDGSGNAE